MSSHECPAKTCTRRVEHEQLACPTHWRKLPWRQRVTITTAWNNGDTGAHAEAISQALTWYRTHDVGQASVYTDYNISTPASVDSGGSCA